MAEDIDHIPVLPAEVMEWLDPKPGQVLLDATLGLGGHAELYLKRTGPDGRVVGLDADAGAAARAKARLKEYGERVSVVVGNFWQIKDLLTGGGILNSPLFHHILFDLGVGSHQLADSRRGFSFAHGETLRMKYGEGDLPPANFQPLNYLTSRLGFFPDVPEIIQGLKESELADLLWTYGEERHSRRIAAALKQTSVPQNAKDLAEVIAQAILAGGKIHPATRSFLALRLAVNRELETLTAALPQAMDLLAPQGRIAVISFHSLEDRIVKNFFRDQDRAQTLKRLTKKPVIASREEIAQNRRARSAKLRVAEKVSPPT